MTNKYLEKVAFSYFQNKKVHEELHTYDMHDAKGGTSFRRNASSAEGLGSHPYAYKRNFINRAIKAKKYGLKGSVIGATIGAALGATSGLSKAHTDHYGRKSIASTGERVRNAVIGAAITGTSLGLAGHELAHIVTHKGLAREATKRFAKGEAFAAKKFRARDAEMSHEFHTVNNAARAANEARRAEEAAAWASRQAGNKARWEEAFSKAHGSSHSRSGSQSYHRGPSIDSIHKDLGVTTPFKNKGEANTHMRRQRSQHHPDKFPEGPQKTSANERMQKLNKAWDDFKAHPEGFEKLANAYLEKIAEIYND